MVTPYLSRLRSTGAPGSIQPRSLSRFERAAPDLAAPWPVADAPPLDLPTAPPAADHRLLPEPAEQLADEGNARQIAAPPADRLPPRPRAGEPPRLGPTPRDLAPSDRRPERDPHAGNAPPQARATADRPLGSGPGPSPGPGPAPGLADPSASGPHEPPAGPPILKAPPREPTPTGPGDRPPTTEVRLAPGPRPDQTPSPVTSGPAPRRGSPDRPARSTEARRPDAPQHAASPPPAAPLRSLRQTDPLAPPDATRPAAVAPGPPARGTRIETPTSAAQLASAEDPAPTPPAPDPAETPPADPATTTATRSPGQHTPDPVARQIQALAADRHTTAAARLPEPTGGAQLAGRHGPLSEPPALRLDPIEISVTIGRIEVRTAPAAAPPPEPAAAGPRRRPATLDAYLRSRSTGRLG